MACRSIWFQIFNWWGYTRDFPENAWNYIRVTSMFSFRTCNNISFCFIILDVTAWYTWWMVWCYPKSYCSVLSIISLDYYIVSCTTLADLSSELWTISSKKLEQHKLTTVSNQVLLSSWVEFVLILLVFKEIHVMVVNVWMVPQLACATEIQTKCW